MLGVARYQPEVIAAALGTETATFLGAGTYGDTWRVGYHAVKVICVDGYPPARVAREIDGLTRVSSPYVVRLHNAGSVVLDGKERPALFFEYVEGGDLQHRIESDERPSASETVALLRGLLTGIRDLHAADGTVHRDIKPANVALRDGKWENPVLLDLGLAKSATETTMTLYPGMVGTPPYMAPEQLKGQRARKASDLFSVGVTVRTAYAGIHPFYEPGANYTYDEALARITAGPIPLPEGLPAPVSSVLDLLVSEPQFERGSATSNLRRMGIES
jgi:serine/threonine protein kinase